MTAKPNRRSEGTANSKDPSLALWRAVILQALTDATSLRVNARGLTQLERSRAIDWFKNNDRDFRQVCVYADLEPEQVRRFALAKIHEAEREAYR